MDSETIAQEPGREFFIGKKIYTLQRNLTDNTWDVCIPSYGWQATGLPVGYSAAQAEEAFRIHFKGGVKRYLARRLQNQGDF